MWFINLPPLTKITKAWDDICLLVETFVDPPSNLKASSINTTKRKCNKACSRTTRSCGYLEQNVLRPSGEDIYRHGMQLSDRILSCIRMRTKLINIILSSGTPCSMSTSTAFMADPPVAASHTTENACILGKARLECRNTHLA